MSLPCAFEFSVSDMTRIVDEQSELWAEHLPASRHPGDTERSKATVGHYFRAATGFLSRDRCRVVKAAVHELLDTDIEPEDLDRIHICLVKHGTFYHPSHVIVSLGDGQSVHLALNLAVSDEGRLCIDREYAALETLSGRTTSVPAVYGQGSVTLDEDIQCAMFAARWFEDFHEFHLSMDQGRQTMVVWDDARGHYFLSDDEIADLYRQASSVMTCCYDPGTCEQIQPWHHAAGDFVVRRNEDGLAVRLITVRQYISMFREIPDDPEVFIDAALIFLISLSIRMRLDRIDGIKETAWADDLCVPAVVRGFYEGLEQTAPGLVLPFRNFVADLDEEDLMERAMMVVGAYHPDSPDLAVIHAGQENHVALLTRVLKTQDKRKKNGCDPR